MKKNIFEAASLESVCYVNGKMEGPGIAHGYKPKAHDTRPGVYVSANSLWEEFDFGEAPFFMSRADKGIYITPEEYVKWLDALYGGRIIEQNYLDQVEYPKSHPRFSIITETEDSLFSKVFFPMTKLHTSSSPTTPDGTAWRLQKR